METTLQPSSSSRGSQDEGMIYSSIDDALKDYKQGSQLGEGSFGRVIKATHKRTGEKMAIKIVENILLCE